MQHNCIHSCAPRSRQSGPALQALNLHMVSTPRAHWGLADGRQHPWFWQGSRMLTAALDRWLVCNCCRDCKPRPLRIRTGCQIPLVPSSQAQRVGVCWALCLWAPREIVYKLKSLVWYLKQLLQCFVFKSIFISTVQSRQSNIQAHGFH